MHPCLRGYSSIHTQQPAKPERETEMDPYILLEDDIKYVTQDIRDVSTIYICRNILSVYSSIKMELTEVLNTEFKWEVNICVSITCKHISTIPLDVTNKQMNDFKVNTV